MELQELRLSQQTTEPAGHVCVSTDKLALHGCGPRLIRHCRSAPVLDLPLPPAVQERHPQRLGPQRRRVPEAEDAVVAQSGEDHQHPSVR